MSLAQPEGDLLAEVVEALPWSLDYDETLTGVAEIAVRSLADFCIIDMVDGATLHRVHVAHADPAYADLTRQLKRYSPDRGRPHVSLHALDTRSAVVVPDVRRSILETQCHDAEHRRIVDALGLHSLMAVPLLAGEEVLGVILLASSSRTYRDEDIAYALLLARFASLEIDHARRYRESQRAVAARDRVLQVVAHDLRSPLNVITLTASFMLEQTPPLRDQAAHIARIIGAAERMERLIRDLLDVARIEADRLALQRRVLDPAAVAREAIEGASPLAAGKHQKLQSSLPDADLRVSGDRDRILQVLTNLIDNATKFTPEHGEIEVALRDEGLAVRFTVKDTGPGIPAESLEQLFEPFWRGGNRSIEGAGLGLAIARGIVEAHGGRIWAESAPGVGSTFHFTLPAASRSDPDVG
ncbi:MAG TPA: ATP-binding protein [Longimicrobiales bacterium]|nr:ATP-binding protein [Longimicrobiales bacterium]